MARVRVRGGNQLLKKLREIPERVHDGAGAGVDESAQALKAAEQQRAPVDTGRLRDSIHVEDTNGPADRPGRRVGPRDDVDYATYQEYGTSKMAAQPYVRPSVEVERGRVPGRVGEQVRDRLPTRKGGRR